MTRHDAVATLDLVRERCPLLADAASRIGYPAIRHRGTLGGSLAHADPVAEMPLIAVTLDAELVAVGPTGERVITAEEFFRSYFTTALGPDELLREVRFPAVASGQGWGFHESSRKVGDFAVVAAAAQVRVDGGVLASARIGLGGVADRPVRASEAEAALAGRPLGEGFEAALDDAAELATRAVESTSDVHASEAFRRRLVRVLARRAVADAVARAEANR